MRTTKIIQNIRSEYKDSVKKMDEKRELWNADPENMGKWGEYCVALGEMEALEKTYDWLKKISIKSKVKTKKEKPTKK